MLWRMVIQWVEGWGLRVEGKINQADLINSISTLRIAHFRRFVPLVDGLPFYYLETSSFNTH